MNQDVDQFPSILVRSIWMHYISWILFAFTFMLFILVSHASIHLYTFQNTINCTRLHGKFVLLTLGESFKQQFWMKCVFKLILCPILTSTMIIIKRLHSIISQFKLKLKDMSNCDIVEKRDEKNINDQSLLRLSFKNNWNYTA